MATELLDLEAAKRHTRRSVASVDGHQLTESQQHLARMLADHLRLREGRDRVQAGEAILEASCCVASLTPQLVEAAGPASQMPVTVLLNILGLAAIDLTDDEAGVSP